MIMTNILKNSLFLGMLTSSFSAFGVGSEKQKSLYIVLILIDDMGYGDLSCYGASMYINTPREENRWSKYFPLLLGDGNANPRESFLYYFQKNSLEAVRKGNWKYVFARRGKTYSGFNPGADGFPGQTNDNFNFEEGLYDLRRDPGERYDVKEYYPRVVAELKKLADDARIDLDDDIQKVKGQNLRESGCILEK